MEQAALLLQPKLFCFFFSSVFCFGVFFLLNHMPFRKSPRSLPAAISLSQKDLQPPTEMGRSSRATLGSKPGPGKPLAPWFKWSIPGFFSLCWDFLVNYVRGVMFYSEAQELGLWSEEEGGRGMLFLLNEHLQASTRGMDDLFWMCLGRGFVPRACC